MDEKSFLIEHNVAIQRLRMEANTSKRRRSCHVLHQKGAYHNQVINFLTKLTYMQPHCHPGKEKIESITVISGRCTVLFFDDHGVVKNLSHLSPGDRLSVPAYSWHTYVADTAEVVTFETMDGIYDPHTWKSMASWAPNEESPNAERYLNELFSHCA